MTEDFAREILPWAGFALTLALLFLRGGYHVGTADEHVVGLDEWKHEITKKVESINGLSEWRANADRERQRLERKIEADHEKHKTAEKEIRTDMTAYIDRVEKRLNDRIDRLEDGKRR